jgi:WD40 repeat protein
MPRATRTFRVFVSSTFEDLKEERNALQRDVFPKLRALCDQQGARFQAIDLRWGVRDEAAFDQQTMAICLREIQRCRATGVRPNFIALLGDRYGWLPLPPTILAAEFDALIPHLAEGDLMAQAERWYRLDENADPPVYNLRPRTDEFVDPAVWSLVEQELHEALAKAARAAGLEAKELIKYEASATHQEILAGLGDSEEDRQHVFGFVRRPIGNTDPQLNALKSRLHVHEFGAGDMNGLCELVLTQLTKVIEAELKRFEDRPAFEPEIEAHDRFAEDHSRIFVGRQAVLNTIAEYIRGPERRPLVLHGESGSGKSAVMAKASQRYKGPGRVIRRFIGASPESASGHALLASLCRQIAPGETPVDYAKLENAFRDRVLAATEDQPLVLFIDALDQLAAGDPARDVTWLPPELPPHVKVILSTTDDVGTYFSISSPPEGRLIVQLGRMVQPEAGQALDELLREARRTLQPWQRDAVLAHFDRCGLPLYLKLAAEESKLWKSYSPEEACTLGEGIAGIVDTLFDRLASNANHGSALVERSLGYLAAARYGLTEEEILDVLTADDAVWADFDRRKHHEVGERRLPVVVWSRLSLDLEPYLTERAVPGGTVVAFFHRQLGEMAAKGQNARHADLARHFGTQAAWLDECRKNPNTRRAAELSFQQRTAGDWGAAEATLLDAPFLLSKSAAGLAIDLQADYPGVLAERPGINLRLASGALTLAMHVLVQDGRQCASQLIGRLLAHRELPAIRQLLDELTCGAPAPWLRPLKPALDSPGESLLQTLEGHRDQVYDVAITPDAKLAISASGDGTLRVWDLETGRELRTLKNTWHAMTGVAVTRDGRRAVSASNNRRLEVWDLRTARALLTIDDRSNTNIDSRYVFNCMAVTPDGKHVVSAFRECTLHVWDLETGRELRTLKGHSGFVVGVAVKPDGKRVISGDSNGTLNVWDLQNGCILMTLQVHAGDVRAVAVTPDGMRAVSGDRAGTLKVWDLESGRVLTTLAGHSEWVASIALTSDGKLAVSASGDGTLGLWELETGRMRARLKGHSDWVRAVKLTPDGNRAVSASADRTLKVWDLQAVPSLFALERHARGVSALAVTPDGKRAISASGDRTLRVWNLETGFTVRIMEGHTRHIYGVAVTPDGRQAISASGDGTLRLWDLETGLSTRILEADGEVHGVAVVRDGQHAVSWSEHGAYRMRLKTWDLRTGCLLGTVETKETALGMAVTTEGGFVILACWSHVLKVCDLGCGAVETKLLGHNDPVYAVALTRDNRRAVSGSGDRTVRVWDLHSGSLIWTLKDHSARVNGVAVSQDGQRAISASEDKMLKMWDLRAGVLEATFHCDAEANCCAFADERRIVAGDAGGRVYSLTLEQDPAVDSPGREPLQSL